MRLSNRLALCALLAIGAALASRPAPAFAAPRASIEITGEPVTVYSWRDERCDDQDVPDAHLRAFRRADGSVMAFASHYVALPLVGPDLLHLKRRCEPAFKSAENPDPAAYDEFVWITGTWTDDGRDVAALGHSEYHAEKHPGRCESGSHKTCRYDVITLFTSNNGGDSFTRASPTPVAAPPIRQPEKQQRTLGMMMPSNIFEYEGWKYAVVRSAGGGEQRPGSCLLRAKDPLQPSSWEMYKDGGFVSSSIDPYAAEAPEPRCSPIPRLSNGLVFSILRHEPTGLFIALMTIIEPKTKEIRLATSVSRDLMDWTRPEIVTDIRFQWANDTCPIAPYWHYPSLIDPDSTRRNFDTIDGDGLLFMSRLNIQGCSGSLDRDLVRMSVKVTVEE